MSYHKVYPSAPDLEGPDLITNVIKPNSPIAQLQPNNPYVQAPISQQFVNNSMQNSGYVAKSVSNHYPIHPSFSQTNQPLPNYSNNFKPPYPSNSLNQKPPAYNQQFLNQPPPYSVPNHGHFPQATNKVLVDRSAFDSGARFNQGARPVLPPCPPGAIPTVHQLAAASGQQVILGKKKRNWFFQKGSGSVFW